MNEIKIVKMKWLTNDLVYYKVSDLLFIFPKTKDPHFNWKQSVTVLDIIKANPEQSMFFEDQYIPVSAKKSNFFRKKGLKGVRK